MTYSVNWSRQALRDLQKLDKSNKNHRNRRNICRNRPRRCQEAQ